MQSNQELMILSFLNLYLAYVDLKRKNGEKVDKKPFYSRIPTKIQSIRTLAKERHVADINNHKQMKSTNNELTSNAKIDETLTMHIEEGKTLNNSKAGNCQNAQITDSRPNHITVAETTQTAVDKETKKGVIKRRKRGLAKKLMEDLEKGLKKKPRIRRWRVRPVNRDRAITGYHRKVFANIKKMDQQQFFEHTRMSKTLFDWLLTFVHSSLRKNKQSILAEERLAITLNYLAYGTSLQSIAWKYKVGKSTARQIVLDTCGVLWNLLSPIYLSEPTTSQYADIADDFKRKFNIPNCVGAIDGKHVSIRIPTKSVPIPNKDGLSIFILGVCDAKYKFAAVSVGNINKQSIDEIFQVSPLNKAIISDKLPLPSSKPLFALSTPFPYFFIADRSFPLQKNIMRPYEGTNLNTTKTIFNYKISRAHAVAENTFGILTARFRVLLTTIEFLPENCKTIILACIALHNFIMTNDEEQLYCPANFVDRENDAGTIEGEWRMELKNNGDQPLPSMITNNSKSTLEANSLRNTLANFFANESISYEIEVVEPN